MFSILGLLVLGISKELEVRAGDVIMVFDGKTLNGWEGNTNNWRVEAGSIVAGSLERRQPHNEFLATRRAFGNFELRLSIKLEGTNGFVNGGVQFWSQRVPNNFASSMKVWMDSGVTGPNVFPHGAAKLMGPRCLFSGMPLQSMVQAKNSSCFSSEAS